MAIVSLIVATADNNCIGVSNKIPWHIPEDFKHFKKITMGKPCIMGRKTYESILDQLGKPLPGRTSVVISRSDYVHDGAVSTNSIADAIEKAKLENPEEIIVAGGAQIYKQALEENLIDRVYLTRVHQSPDGDAFFPELNPHDWKETEKDERDGFTFLTFERNSD
ncbi:MAG: dihydrofolate reductase [Pseudomonadota bacterium]